MQDTIDTLVTCMFKEKIKTEKVDGEYLITPKDTIYDCYRCEGTPHSCPNYIPNKPYTR